MSLPYREFAAYVLGDIFKRAKPARRDPEDIKTKVVFKGNHGSHQYQLPVRTASESEEQYRRRLAEFRKTLPRAHDQVLRLALAVEALRRDGYDSWAAANKVRRIMQHSMIKSAQKQKRYQQKGIAWARVRFTIGETKRSRRSVRKKRKLSIEERMTDTIRQEAGRYKRQHPEFQQVFDFSFQMFRAEFHRDGDWYSEAEPVYHERMLQAELELGEDHWLTAMHTSNYAHLLHELSRFTDAKAVYQLAIARWQTARVPEGFRGVAIRGIDNQIERCGAQQPPGPVPVYDSCQDAEVEGASELTFDLGGFLGDEE